MGRKGGRRTHTSTPGRPSRTAAAETRLSFQPEPPGPPRKLSLPPFNEYVTNLLNKYNLTVDFPTEIENAALAAIRGDDGFLPPEGGVTLVDLTDRPYVTIDNDDSMDLDQAMFIAPWFGPPPRRGRDNGDVAAKGGITVQPKFSDDSSSRREPEPDSYLVSYALADGRHYVSPSSPLYRSALERGGVSFYLPGLCVPMLPRSLSEDAMSLNQGVDRRALVMEMVVDAETGEVQHAKPIWAKVRSRWKGSYRLVQEYYDAVDGKKRGEGHGDGNNTISGAEYEETIRLLRTVGELRRRLMRSRNIVELRRTAMGIAYDPETGSLVKRKTERYKSELLNEQISLMCNMEGARILEALDVVEDLVGARDDVTPIYRYQDAPRQDQIDTLVSLIDELVELHQLDKEVFTWVPPGSSGLGFGGEFLGSYLKRLHHRIDGGNHDGNPHPLEADVLRAIDRQAVVTNVGAHFGGEARPHHSLRVDAYARFSSPMRELVGCFTHKQLWDGIFAARLGLDTSVNDPDLRGRLIKAAASAKRTQKRLSSAAALYVIDLFFSPDLEMEEPDRPRRRGAVVGIDSLAQSKKRSRGGNVYVQIDELELKVSIKDLQRIFGTKYGPSKTIGQYGVTVEILPEDIAMAPAFFVGQSVDLSVFDYDDKKYWIFKIVPSPIQDPD